MAAWLLTAGDRGGESPLYNVDHLLELWEEIHAQVPASRLWLVGGASPRVRERLEGRDDVLAFGRLPREQALAHVANFDLALYPRTMDQGIQAAKVAEYMGLGVPTISYDYEVTEVLRETGAGVLVALLGSSPPRSRGSPSRPAARAGLAERGAAGRQGARLGRARGPLRDRDPRPLPPALDG